MKFLLDHNIDRRFIKRLRDFGFDALHASDLFPDRTPDPVLRKRAELEGAIVVTRDKEFFDSWILNRKPKLLVLLRSYDQDQRKLIEAFATVLPALEMRVNAGATELFFELTHDGVWIYHKP